MAFEFELKPKGKFLLTLEDGQYVKGWFSMYALDRFAQQQGLKSYLSLIGKLTLGMSIQEYCELILVAIEDYYREDTDQCTVEVEGVKKRWTWQLVRDLVLEELELGNAKSKAFFTHAIGRLAEIVEDAADGEKKNLTTNQENQPSQ